MKKITDHEYRQRIADLSYKPLDSYAGAHSHIRFMCNECGTVWIAAASKAIQDATGCPTCRPSKIAKTLRLKNKNNVIADHGDWLEIDVSTPKNQSAVMKIDKEDWDSLLALNLGHVFSDKHRHTMYAKVWVNRTKKLRVHRHVLKNANVIDHIDGDGLNNRRKNLRNCDFFGNAQNHRINRRNKTGVSGVMKINDKTWTASISFNKKITHLGTFRRKADAVQARKNAEIKYYGEFAPCTQ